MNKFDAIVIGAGNGGLAAAATLQRGGMRTLLLERHNIPGGSATSFVRGDFEFEVALHQLSGMGTKESPSLLRLLFQGLGISDKLDFIEEHELYRFMVPGVIDITLPVDIKELKRTLKEAFPAEAAGIDKFLLLCEVMMVEVFMSLPAARLSGDPKAIENNCRNFVAWGMKDTKAVLDAHFNDPMLKAALGSYWSYLGLPLDDLPFADLGMVFFVYIAFKPYHVRGGSQSISHALLDTFLEAGGEVRFNCGAEKILTDDGAVRGVRVETGEEFACGEVISNASSVLTYTHLLDKPALAAPAQEDFKSRRIGPSGFIIYMGLDCTAEELGVTTATNFIGSTIDDRAIYERTHTLDDPLGCVFTFYSLNDPTLAPPGKCVAALMCLQYGAPWESVAPEDYAQTKFAFAERLMALAETGIPGFRDHIEEIEVATPLTLMRFLNTPGGAIYGFEQNATEMPIVRQLVAPVRGLHLAGAWMGMGGFQPAYQAGARVAEALLRQQSGAAAGSER